MGEATEKKKLDKQTAICDAGYTLFLQKGFHKTSIDDIVKQAGIAKGTFYLYYKDKSDLLHHLVYKISSELLYRGYENAKAKGNDDVVQAIIDIIEYIIDYFEGHKPVLALLERNFNWPIFHEELTGETPSGMHSILDECMRTPQFADYTRDELTKLLFVIMELAGSLCYSSIILGEPDTMENMKPLLYRMVRKLLQ